MKVGRRGICPDGLAKRTTFTLPEAVKDALWQYCAARRKLPSQTVNEIIMEYEGEPPAKLNLGKRTRVTFNLCPSTLEKLKSIKNKSHFVAYAIFQYIQEDRQKNINFLKKVLTNWED